MLVDSFDDVGEEDCDIVVVVVVGVVFDGSIVFVWIAFLVFLMEDLAHDTRALLASFCRRLRCRREVLCCKEAIE